jgi:hypothetical protein
MDQHHFMSDWPSTILEIGLVLWLLLLGGGMIALGTSLGVRQWRDRVAERRRSKSSGV